MYKYQHRADRMVIDPDGDYVHKYDVRKLQVGIGELKAQLQTALEEYEGRGQWITELKGELEKHRWIPVSEPPKEPKWKLVITPFSVFMAKYHKDKWRPHYQINAKDVTCVTHWKPIILPEGAGE